MKLMIYNIAYGTGAPNAFYEHLWKSHRYLRTPQKHLKSIIDFIEKEAPDILGLIEVDTGSIRTNFVNQVKEIANSLNHFHHSSVKYGIDSIGRSIPILRMQGNAVLTKKEIPDSQFHYFPVGFKRLIIELDIGGISFFLVHLSLKRRIRSKQLLFLEEVAKKHKNIIIAGDFNLFRGVDEIRTFQERLGLVNSNKESLPTFPSWKPTRQLDFILHSKNIEVTNFSIPKIRYSDHLPIIMEYKLNDTNE